MKYIWLNFLGGEKRGDEGECNDTILLIRVIS
jgi:hypothetical protein